VQEVAHAAAALEGAICVQRAVLRTLFEAERRGHRSITFPALGTGTAGVPHGLGARLMLEAIRTFASFAPKYCRSGPHRAREQRGARIVVHDARRARRRSPGRLRSRRSCRRLRRSGRCRHTQNVEIAVASSSV